MAVELEPERLADVVADDAVFVILDEDTGDTLRLYQDGSLLCLDPAGQRHSTSELKVIVNKLPALIGEAGQRGFDGAMAIMEDEQKGLKRRGGETVAEYVARINEQVIEERRKWAEAEKASTGETREKGTPKKRG